MLNYRYNRMHFVAGVLHKNLPGGNIPGRETTFLSGIGLAPGAKQRARAKNAEKSQIGTSIFCCFVL